MARQNIYDRLVDLTSELLGPASKRFIDRQIMSHLHIKPQELQLQHLDELSEWIRISIALLTDDVDMIHAYSQALRQIATEEGDDLAE